MKIIMKLRNKALIPVSFVVGALAVWGSTELYNNRTVEMSVSAQDVVNYTLVQPKLSNKSVDVTIGKLKLNYTIGKDNLEFNQSKSSKMIVGVGKKLEKLSIKDSKYSTDVQALAKIAENKDIVLKVKYKDAKFLEAYGFKEVK